MHNYFINAVITVFWIVLITNSFNLLDNMDGLSSGIAAITTFIFSMVAINQGQYSLALFSIIITASCLGFLIFNFSPASIFMGDGGFMMGGANEFNTAVRTKRDLIVIICNDSAYGAEHIQMLDRKMDPSLTEFDWPSLANVAKAMGGQGLQVTSPRLQAENGLAKLPCQNPEPR